LGSDRAAAASSDTWRYDHRVLKRAFLAREPSVSFGFSATYPWMRCAFPGGMRTHLRYDPGVRTVPERSIGIADRRAQRGTWPVGRDGFPDRDGKRSACPAAPFARGRAAAPPGRARRSEGLMAHALHCRMLGGLKPSPSGDGFSVLRYRPGRRRCAGQGRPVRHVGAGRPRLGDRPWPSMRVS
jgi:hypothetical protein